LDSLLAAHQDEGSELWSRFDPGRVAALGHSLGGATLLGLTRFEEREPRIGAQLYLSPAVPLTSPIGAVVEPSGPPTLVMHGLEDTTLDPGISEDLYADLEDPRWYLGLSGAGHSDPIESQDEPPVPSRAAAQGAVQALIGQVFLGESGAVDRILDELAAEGHTVLP
jgi:acetyl esterase/lipase